MTLPVFSWGRLTADEHQVVPVSSIEALPRNQKRKGLPFGNGRSYGDVCLNPNGELWLMRGLDKFIEFDRGSGLITCEAGVLLREIQKLVVPQGWMLPVTPGTQMLTVGGAIANDIHGKNHHVFGTFGDHVISLTLHRTDGSLIECGPMQDEVWFRATVGGMGLTGVISQATLQLRPIQGALLEAENIPFTDIASFFELANESEVDWEYTVSWIDCLNRQGRGVFMRGNHVSVDNWQVPAERSFKFPFTPPVSLINSASLRFFNLAYFQLQKRKREKSLVHYEPFFYPLDNVLNWNRMYGYKGFYQYQSVVPREAGIDAVKEMLKEISNSSQGSFLAVLKTFGERSPLGMMSFPMPGVTLALDFPNNGEKTLALFRRLDSIVRDAGGRIYAAKDSRMPKDMFEIGYPMLNEFLKYRDPGISSAMSRRLLGS